MSGPVILRLTSTAPYPAPLKKKVDSHRRRGYRIMDFKRTPTNEPSWSGLPNYAFSIVMVR